MPRSTIHRVAGFVALWLSLLTGAAAGQKFSLADVKASRVGGVAVPGAQRALLFYAERARRDSTVLRQYWLDEQMHLRHNRPVVVRGPYLLQRLIRSRANVLYQFKRRGYDSLISVVVDTLGRTVATRRENLKLGLPRGIEYLNLDLPTTNGFFVIEPAANRSCRLVCRTPDLRLAWSKTFGRRAEIVAGEADSSRLWLITTVKQLSRHPKSEAVCLDLRTGQELSRTPIGPAESSWVPATMHVGSQHELRLVGYAFKHAASRNRTGDLFYLRLSADGRAISQRQVALARTADVRVARRGRVHWSLVQPGPHDQLRLVGETFVSNPYGVVLLRTMLSFGLLQYTVLRPHDVFSLTLDSASQIHDVHTTAIARDGGSFVWPGYAPGRILASIAAQYLTFRYRGLASGDNATIVLRTPRQVQTLNVATQQLITVRQKPAVGQVDVWHVGPDFMLLYQEDAGRRTLEVERVPIEGMAGAQVQK